MKGQPDEIPLDAAPDEIPLNAPDEIPLNTPEEPETDGPPDEGPSLLARGVDAVKKSWQEGAAGREMAAKADLLSPENDQLSKPFKPLAAVADAVAPDMEKVGDNMAAKAQETGEVPYGRIALAMARTVPQELLSKVLPRSIRDVEGLAMAQGAKLPAEPVPPPAEPLLLPAASEPRLVPEAPPVPPVEPAPAIQLPAEGTDLSKAEVRQPIAAEGLAKAPELTQPGIAEKVVGDIADEAAKLKNSPIANDTTKRAFARIMNLIETGEILPESLSMVAEKNGIKPVELAAMVGEEFSKSGRILNKASQMVKALNAAYESNPEVAEILKNMPQTPQTWWTMLRDDVIRPVENTRRRLLVTQLQTAARNVSSQGARYVLQGLDDAMAGVAETVTGRQAPKAAFANAIEDIAAIGRALKPGENRMSLNILEKFPTEAARLIDTPVGDVALGGKALNLLNSANRAQEYFFRRMMVDARIMGYLRKQGINIDVGTNLDALPKIPPKVIEDAVSSSLETTFASNPGKGSFTQAVLNVYREMPFLSALGNSFPRFFGNSVDFLVQHSPLGFARYFSPEMRSAFMNGERSGSQAASRAVLGTTMMGAGYALREGPWAGPKWYQVKLPDGRLVDIRPFAPFSTYAFLGEIIREAQGKPTQMTPGDYVMGALGMNRIAGSGLAVVDAARARDFNGVNKFLKQFAGEWAGSFATPARTVKDFAGDLPGQFGVNERTLRSSNEDLLTGPVRKNIPGLSQTLPALASPFRPSPIVPKQGYGVLRQMTGLSLREMNPLEVTANQLGIGLHDVAPKTGDPTLDRMVMEKMGAIADQLGPNLLNAVGQFKNPDEAKAVFMQFMSEVKHAAADQVVSEHPELALGQKAKGMRGLKRIFFERKLQEESNGR